MPRGVTLNSRPQFGPPQYRPLKGKERRPNPGGDYSTELTMTDKDPQGRYEVYPSLWMGPKEPVEVSRRAGMKLSDMYEKFGYEFPRFKSLDESEEFAIKRSKKGGVGTGPLAKTK